MNGTVFVVFWISAITGVILESSHEVCFIGSQHDLESGTQPRWFIPTDDPCACTAIRLEGITVKTALFKRTARFYLEKLVLSEDPGEIHAFFKCPESTNACLNPKPLGLADGSIPDERFRASSHFAFFFASNARLNQESYWHPNVFGDCWVEVDLVNNTLVSGIITQGSSTSNEYRVTKYKVEYQTLPSQLSVYDYVTYGNGSIQVFNGNIDDATTPVANFFYNSIMATIVHLVPVEWSRGIAFRFELLGCELD